MIKLIKYFFEAFFIYLFFVIAKLIGLKLSRSLFSSFFKSVGPLIRSKRIIYKNLKIFSPTISEKKIKEINSDM